MPSARRSSSSETTTRRAPWSVQRLDATVPPMETTDSWRRTSAASCATMRSGCSKFHRTWPPIRLSTMEQTLSALAVPVRVAGQRVCALVVAAREPSNWDDQIVGRVQLLAEILAYAVHRRRQARTLRLREAELTKLSTQLKSEAVYLREEIQSLHGFNEIIGDSGACGGARPRAGRPDVQHGAAPRRDRDRQGAVRARDHERSPRRQRRWSASTARRCRRR